MECQIPKFNANPEEIKKILTESKAIAVVGLSPKPNRPSHGIARYLMDHGYKVIPVNPGHKEILGLRCYSSLREVEEPVDLVDVFRRPEAVPEIVEEALAIKAKFLWLQEGIVHNEAAEKAKKAGMLVVMNKCIFKAHAALK